MPSQAVVRWRTDRSARLDELIEAHERVGGTGVGRRTETEQINWALVLRLAAEFQGFARDLHSEASDIFASWSAAGNAQLESVIVALLSRQLQLDRGNARPASLADAFERFGLRWWAALRNRDGRTRSREEQLERLNRARNAIAHSLPADIQQLRREGYPLTLDTVRRWRSALNGLSATMDAEVSNHLGVFFSRPRPW